MLKLKKSDYQLSSDIIKKRLNVRMIECDFTRVKLAKSLNVNVSTLSSWLGKNGDVDKLSLPRLREICSILHFSISELLSDVK